MNRVYHVAKSGSDRNPGTSDAPFLTIQQAADIAQAGDRVVVHEGVYREWVRPRNGGWNENSRIVYEAAPGEHVVIKGSEPLTGWTPVEGTVWRVTVPDSLFQNRNPYRTPLGGDWFISPRDYTVHAGEVYLNGKSFYEARSLEEVLRPRMRTVSPHETWGGREEAILEPERTLYQWFCEVGEDTVTIYANFQGADPNRELVEINVRRACFFPEKTGMDYITVRGFEMAQAATTWTPPTAMQEGLIGPFWSKGWIIENNVIHDSRCSGISIGKEGTTGENDFTRFRMKPGYQNQLEAVCKARHIGWSRERVGSHIIRNNLIYDCGQNGIVGHLGCVFSEIYGNEIYNIAVKHEFYGHEIAGIKLHAAIDVQLHHNYIHHCALGTWLDWQAQGTRVSGNIYDANNRDFMIEVTHGPCLIDNNIFTSPYTFDNAAQGSAFVHNLCCGFMNAYPVRNRATPYHLPHSTEILGTALTYGGDDRWIQNIFVGGSEEGRTYGTAYYNGSPVSLEGYLSLLPPGDVESFEQVRQPVCIAGNVYLNGAPHFDREKDFRESAFHPAPRIVEEDETVYLEVEIPGDVLYGGRLLTSEHLGFVRIVGQRFENPDGSPLRLNRDMNGTLRSERPIPGPVENLKPGKNRIVIWQKRL
ncbi:MAG: hypothetical protein K2P37_06515 [Oscillospiraceae bacterium]|nr:hypothetical protein [Oscillospiraceae bacterium]